MFEELKGKETHSRDLQFLVKWTSSSNSNNQVWTNGPADTYCQCLPSTASTPSPNSSRTTTQQHILGVEVRSQHVSGRAQHPTGRDQRWKVCDMASSASTAITYFMMFTWTNRVQMLAIHFNSYISPAVTSKWQLQQQAISNAIIWSWRKKERIGFYKGKENVQYFIQIAMIHYAQGTKEGKSRTYITHTYSIKRAWCIVTRITCVTCIGMKTDGSGDLGTNWFTVKG